jgi:hypothetical protein
MGADLTVRATGRILARMEQARNNKPGAAALLALAMAAIAPSLAAQSAIWVEGKATLNAETKLASGMTAKAGEIGVWYVPGDSKTKPVMSSCVLAVDFAMPSGAKLRSGSSVGFWPGGEFRFLTLAEDWKGPSGIPMAGGTKVSLFQNGSWEEFTPQADLPLGAGLPTARAMRSLSFYADGALRGIVLAADFPWPTGGLVCEAGSYLSLYEKGALSVATFTSAYVAPNGMKWKPHEALFFSEAGRVTRGTLAEPYDAGGGLLVKDEVELSQAGKPTSAYLAKEYALKRDPSPQAILADGSHVVFREDGSLGLGTLAKAYGVIPAGALVSESDLEQAFNPGYIYDDGSRDQDEYEDGEEE